MTTSTNHKPAATLRDGSLKATLWRKQSENGVFFNVTLSRTYKDGEAYKDANSFSGAELLRIARLAGKAYDLADELRATDSDDGAQQ
jgi:5-methylthioribose kinase